jgi:hypothetical protein
LLGITVRTLHGLRLYIWNILFRSAMNAEYAFSPTRKFSGRKGPGRLLIG